MTLRPSIITGLPSGTKEAGQRVDFKPDKFDLAIKTKGQRAWWSRAGICPCRNNAQTDQADINCPVCNGDGWFYYLPELGVENYTADIHGNPIEINESNNAIGIFALVSHMTQDTQVYEKFGEWVFGTIRVTVQAENSIGYRDRLILRDSKMTYGQLITSDGSAKINVVGGRSDEGLRYPVVDPILLCQVSNGVRINYRLDTDYAVDDDGGLSWLITPPATDTLLFINYRMHPIFKILDHAFAMRDTLVYHKKRTADVAEQHQMLPIHAMARLDFLVDD
jgi:hypothetical protein